MTNKTGYIAGIARGHNSGICLLKDGEIVFSIEEERLSRRKYDGGPIASMVKILEYTDKIDYLVIAHTSSVFEDSIKCDYSGDDIYTATARKLGLIDQYSEFHHPQVIDLSSQHHKLHAACAFYRSGFETATAIVVDGAGTLYPLEIPIFNNHPYRGYGWETESIFDCNYPAKFNTIYKHIGTQGPLPPVKTTGKDPDSNNSFDIIVSEFAGITKVYEGVTQFLGFQSIDAGKTMGLFPYGEKNDKIPPLFIKNDLFTHSNRNIISPTYPNGSAVNSSLYNVLNDEHTLENDDLTSLKSRRDMAYAVQIESQQTVLELILQAVETTGNKNVVLSGGYGLNCVANYFYLDELNKHGINLYVEPVSNDAGTAMGAALLYYREISQDSKISVRSDSVYLGPKYNYTQENLTTLCDQYNGKIHDATDTDIIKLLIEKNIVAIFQGKSENGPRALGNRSILFDPRFKDGKDFVNSVKRREYFRPFAGTILEEDVHEWFDLKGMKSSPTMMYAVNCKPGVEEKIPAIIHVDGTCRIQTISEQQNKIYYDLISEFKKETGIPILFNTSFNLGGEPLVETLNDALRTLYSSDIEYLYLPELKKLVKIDNFER